jgi:hypothetical protein
VFINAYPATVPTYAPGISVDTYLSPRMATRALQLAAVTERTALFVAQPLLAAHMLLRHVAGEFALPKTMFVCVGGYALPQSLERTLAAVLAPHVAKLYFLQYFGAAEVDAGCFVGRDREPDGALIYRPRPDIEPALDGDDLLLTRRGADGEVIVDRFRTGDNARRSGDGWVIWNDRRYHPDVRRELESWTEADWRRRTGHARREGDDIWIQLRAGDTPQSERELEHFEFARRYGFAWLDKPYWR